MPQHACAESASVTPPGKFDGWATRETTFRFPGPGIRLCLPLYPASLLNTYEGAMVRADLQSNHSFGGRSEYSSMSGATTGREARQNALSELRRLRRAEMMEGRIEAARERANQAKSANLEKLADIAQQRQIDLENAIASKREQEARKAVAAKAEADVKAMSRVIKQQRVAQVKERQQEEYAMNNRAVEERRQHMLKKVAAEEVEVRNRLASEIVAHDLAGRMRKRHIADAKELEVQKKAVETEAQLRRAQSAKTVQEAQIIKRINAEAAVKERAREERVEKANARRAQEREVYVKRNAEEEVRRLRALELVKQKEAFQQQVLVQQVVQQNEAAKKRLSSAAVDRLREEVEKAQELKKKQAKALVLKEDREKRAREVVLAAAAAREKERRLKEERVEKEKEEKRLYFAKRNQMHDQKYQERELASFAADVAAINNGTDGVTPINRFGSVARSVRDAVAPPRDPSPTSGMKLAADWMLGGVSRGARGAGM